MKNTEPTVEPGFTILVAGDIIPEKYQYWHGTEWRDGDICAGGVWVDWKYEPMRVPLGVKIMKGMR